MKRAHARTIVAVGTIGVMGVGGCQAVLGLGDLSPADGGVHVSDASPPKKDATTFVPDGATDASPPRSDARDAAEAASDATDAGCAVIYVSNTLTKAADTNSGCDPAAPVKTITQGLVNAQVTLADGAYPEVRICSGTYPERNLALAAPITVRGAFDCMHGWTHDAGWGFPTFQKPTLVISSNNDGEHPATFGIGPTAGAVPDGSVVLVSNFTIEGLTVQGPSTFSDSSAVHVRYGFAPTLTNNKLLGGNVTNQITGSSLTAALLIEGAAPEVTSNLIQLPTMMSGAPSIGVHIVVDSGNASMASIHGNMITGGPGTALPGGGTGVGARPKPGSVGILVAGPLSTNDGSTPKAMGGGLLASNFISAGTGVTSIEEPGATGLFIEGRVTVEATGNVINGGSGAVTDPTTATGVVAAGVSVQSGASVTLLGNQIYGGTDGTVGTGTVVGPGGTAGVIASSSHLVLANNLIHGGNVGTAPTVATRAVELDGVDVAVVEDNTLYPGSTLAGDAAANSVFVLTLTNGGNGNLIRGNILGGSRITKGILNVDDCAEVSLLERNLFVGDISASLQPNGCQPEGGTVTPGGPFKSLLSSYGSADPRGNLLLAHACGGADREAGLCAADCPDGGCMPWLLTGLTTAVGPSGVLADGGPWGLRDGAICMIARGGVNLAQTEAGPPITTDILDAGRPLDGSSMGARQFFGPCAQP